MNKQSRGIGLPLAGAATFVLCVILVLLGNWQWQRLQWKEGLIRQLEESAKAASVPLRELRLDELKGIDLAKIRYRRVIVEGTFDHANEFHVWAPGRDGPAWSVITPLRLAPGQDGRVSNVFIVRGVVPAARKSKDTRSAGQPQGVVRVTGRVRLSQSGNDWAPAPNTQKNEWFARDLEMMRQHVLKGRPPASGYLTGFALEAVKQIGGPEAPKPDLKALQLSNRHLEYALTWWALAATFAVMFLAFAWATLRRGKQGEAPQGRP